MAIIKSGQEVLCPNCALQNKHSPFCRTTADGRAVGHFWCTRCNLDFVISLPLPTMIFLKSASALLIEKAGYDMQKAQSALGRLIECVAADGEPLLLWSRLEELLSPKREKIFLRRTA